MHLCAPEHSGFICTHIRTCIHSAWCMENREEVANYIYSQVNAYFLQVVPVVVHLIAAGWVHAFSYNL